MDSMNVGMSDPNHTGAFTPNAGGNTKVKPTSTDGTSYDGTMGYGFMNNADDPHLVSSGEKQTGTTLPVAETITPLTYGDPNNSSAGFPS